MTLSPLILISYVFLIVIIKVKIFTESYQPWTQIEFPSCLRI